MGWKESFKYKILRLYSKMLHEKASPEFIARGWAIGVFYGCVLPFGVQLLFSIPTAILLRASKFGAATGTFISNHFTIFIIYPLQCYLGARIINKPISYGGIKVALRKVISEQSYEAFSALSSELCLAFLIGGVVFAMILTPITYTLVLQMVTRHRNKRAGKANAASSVAPPES